jgi:hypothetical protein
LYNFIIINIISSSPLNKKTAMAMIPKPINTLGFTLYIYMQNPIKKTDPILYINETKNAVKEDAAYNFFVDIVIKETTNQN